MCQTKNPVNVLIIFKNPLLNLIAIPPTHFFVSLTTQQQVKNEILNGQPVCMQYFVYICLVIISHIRIVAL